ncbi:hypothetical protein V6N13_074102 [Hibiscus sabdariffa]
MSGLSPPRALSFLKRVWSGERRWVAKGVRRVEIQSQQWWVGEEDVGAFLSMVKDWGGLALPVGHAPLASTTVCVRGETNLFLMRVFLNRVGMVDLSVICYFKLCFQCLYLGADFFSVVECLLKIFWLYAP